MPPKKLDGPADISKADFSAFSMAMKAAAKKGDAVKVALFEHYSGLSRFDKEKAEIVKMFKCDKACNWWVGYAEKSFKQKTTERQVTAGWGSRTFFLCFLFCCFFVFSVRKLVLNIKT